LRERRKAGGPCVLARLLDTQAIDLGTQGACGLHGYRSHSPDAARMNPGRVPGVHCQRASELGKHYKVELRRFELLTSCMPCKRSTN
jgi:hypothetical protein